MSVVPDALEALVAGFAAAVPPRVTVIDGPPWDPPTDDYLCVGFTGNPDESGVSVVAPMTDYGDDEGEVGEVSNYLRAFVDEGATVAGTRRRAVDIYSACRAWVAANRYLDGLVTDTRVSDFALGVLVEESGITVTLLFTVAFKAIS